MPAYDATWFDPPAPVAKVTLRNPERDIFQSDVSMLIDTGADITLVPQAIVSQLGVVPIPGKQYEVVGFGGSPGVASVVRVELIFCRRTFRGQFLLVEQEWGILGRNVLNAVSLLLHGPSLTWEDYRSG
ncbi:MAG: retropepsin-like aspartic protease [Chloroflexaceae bacterium]